MPETNTPRLRLIDALRGFAVAQMIVYHFIYDLRLFGWIDIAMTRDQPWVGWRTAIVSQFLLLVGASLVLRTTRKPQGREFVWRWAQVAGAALLVSFSSWWLFGPRLIYFGILHFIAVALLIGRATVPLGRANLALAAIVFAVWLLVADPMFNRPPLNIVGFITVKPRTEDFVPLFPWLAAVFAGIGLASMWRERGFALPPALQRLDRASPRVLVGLGRWALTAYLLHQPALLATLWLLHAALGAG